MMGCQTIHRQRVAEVLVGLAVVCWVEYPCQAAGDKPMPEFNEVEETVLRHFSMLPDYQPGDIITRSEVQPLFAQLKRMGWLVADRKTILNNVPADSDFLVRQLRTRQGRKFMRQVSAHANSYDQLERISALPYGRRTVHELIREGSKGAGVIEHFVSTPEGAQVGRQMARKPRSADFNKPTGRIYTAEMLLERLETSHRAAKKATEAAEP